MTQEAMKLALEALQGVYWSSRSVRHDEAITALQEALAQQALDKMAENARELGLDYEPEQEPVAWGVFDGPNLHDMFFTEEEAQDMARLKGDGSVVKPLRGSNAP